MAAGDFASREPLRGPVHVPCEVHLALVMGFVPGQEDVGVGYVCGLPGPGHNVCSPSGV